jgi:hypothetical protein
VLVDEFNIPHTPYKNLYTFDMHLDPAIRSKDQYILESNPAFLKYIEFDDLTKTSLDIKLAIKNDDNNYANGFMTQHTLIQLCNCWLAPVKVWEEFDQLRDHWKYSKHSWHKWHNQTESLTHYYIGQRNEVFDNLAIYADMHFPDITRQLDTNQHQMKLVNKGQHSPKIKQYNADKYWVGSSGYFHLTLAKKLGFWRHSTDRRRGWWKISNLKNIKDFYNKYKNDEDTRSTNQ